MVPGMPGKPEEPGQKPQICDIDYSPSREWDHQGCLHPCQEGQEGHLEVLEGHEGHPGVFPQFQYCGLTSGGICDGLSVIGYEGLHCILTQ